jgi:hypothetical protein
LSKIIVSDRATQLLKTKFGTIKHVPKIAETHQNGYLLPFDAIKNGPKLMIKMDP